jgi:hypothetical protein
MTTKPGTNNERAEHVCRITVAETQILRDGKPGTADERPVRGLLDKLNDPNENIGQVQADLEAVGADMATESRLANSVAARKRLEAVATESVSIRKVMIAYIPPSALKYDHACVPRIWLIRWPERGRRATRRFARTTGACVRAVHKMKPIERRHFVMSLALGLIVREGFAQADVHRALWPIKEYRDGLPRDTPAPAVDTRFGGRFAYGGNSWYDAQF